MNPVINYNQQNYILVDDKQVEGVEISILENIVDKTLIEVPTRNLEIS